MKKICYVVIVFCILFSFSLESIQAQGRTPAGFVVTTTGTAAAGIRKSTWIFSSNFTGTVLGIAWAGPADTYIQIDAPAGETLGPIAYTVTAGSIRVITVR